MNLLRLEVPGTCRKQLPNGTCTSAIAGGRNQRDTYGAGCCRLELLLLRVAESNTTTPQNRYNKVVQLV